MLSQAHSRSDQEYQGPAPTKIIPSQEQYRLCQIRVPDLEQSVPGLYVDDEYYLISGIGRLRLVGSYDLHFYQPEQIKRVRLVKRADGYYCQFILSVDVQIDFG